MQSSECVVEPGRVILDATLNMAAARVLAQQLAGHRGSDVTIDASAVQHLGAQCVQVLLAAAGTWEADNARFAVVDPSPAFEDGARLLGFPDIFHTRKGA